MTAELGASGSLLRSPGGATVAAFPGVPAPRTGGRDFGLGELGTLTLYDTDRFPQTHLLEELACAAALVHETQGLRLEVERLSGAVRASFEVAREICSVTELEGLLRLVAEKSRELLGCELAGFALLEDSGDTIVWKAMSGCLTDVYRNFTFRRDGGVAGRAITSRKPVIVDDFFGDRAFDPREFPISFAEGLRSVLGVPLEIAGSARGCLMIGYRCTHAFTPQEVDLLTSFAAQAAIAIENAQLYERLSREQARLESIVQSMNEGIVLVDVAGRILYVNHRAEELFGVGGAAYAGRDAQAFIDAVLEHLTDAEHARTELARVRAAVVGFPSFDVHRSGEQARTIRVTLFGVYDARDVELGRGYLCRDVTLEAQVDALKSEVISIVSHELRTPLASIRGYASALLDRPHRRDAAVQAEYLRIIDQESTRLDVLVTTLLDVSKLDAGVLELDRRPLDVAALVARRVAHWRTSTPEVTFSFAAASALPPCSLDHWRIEQVLDNVLKNAVEQAGAGTTVRVRVESEGEALVISIADEGPGLESEHVERVFERFYRAGAGRPRRGSSGLGLYISRGIVNAHGGHMWLQSRPGEGATFFFTLPVVSRLMARTG